MGRGVRMEGCGQFMKYTLWIINVICLIGGIVVLGVGSWIVADQSYMQELLGTRLYISAAYIMIAMGVLITLIALLGCIGSIKEVKCLLLTYAVVLFIIFVVLLVGGILAFVFRGEAEDTVKKEMIETMKLYKTKDVAKQAWDDAQKKLKCCGVEKPLDEWNGNLNNGQVPASCCKPDEDCANSPTSANSYIDDPCLSKLKTQVKENAIILGAVAIVIAVMLILGIVFSCALYKTIE